MPGGHFLSWARYRAVSPQGRWAGAGSRVMAHGGSTPGFLGPNGQRHGAHKPPVFLPHGSWGQKPGLGFGEGPVCAKSDLSELHCSICTMRYQRHLNWPRSKLSLLPLSQGTTPAPHRPHPEPKSFRAAWPAAQTGLNLQSCPLYNCVPH